MKRFKKAIALLLALSTMFVLMISAGATEHTLLKSQSKSTSFGTIKGEVWTYNFVENGTSWMEPTAKTIVSSQYTMAETTCVMDCKYNDTGALVNGDATGRARVSNSNNAKVNLYFSVQRPASVVAFTSHGATYSKSDVLYMTTYM